MSTSASQPQNHLDNGQADRQRPLPPRPSTDTLGPLRLPLAPSKPRPQLEPAATLPFRYPPIPRPGPAPDTSNAVEDASTSTLFGVPRQENDIWEIIKTMAAGKDDSVIDDEGKHGSAAVSSEADGEDDEGVEPVRSDLSIDTATASDDRPNNAEVKSARTDSSVDSVGSVDNVDDDTSADDCNKTEEFIFSAREPTLDAQEPTLDEQPTVVPESEEPACVILQRSSEIEIAQESNEEDGSECGDETVKPVEREKGKPRKSQDSSLSPVSLILTRSLSSTPVLLPGWERTSSTSIPLHRQAGRLVTVIPPQGPLPPTPGNPDPLDNWDEPSFLEACRGIKLDDKRLGEYTGYWVAKGGR